MALNTTPSDPSADSYATVAEATAFLQNRTDVSDWDALTTDQKEAALKLATKHIDTLRFFSNLVIPVPMYYRDKQALRWPRTKQDEATGVVDSAGNTTIIDAGLAGLNNRPDDFWNGGAVIITEGTGRGQTRKISDFDSATGTVTVDTAWTTNPDTTSTFRLITKIPDKVKYATIEQALYLVKGGGQRARLQAEGVTQYSIGDLSETFGDGGGNSSGVAISNEAKGYLQGLVTKIGKLI